jgi:hypothetical protein
MQAGMNGDKKAEKINNYDVSNNLFLFPAGPSIFIESLSQFKFATLYPIEITSISHVSMLAAGAV